MSGAEPRQGASRLEEEGEGSGSHFSFGAFSQSSFDEGQSAGQDGAAGGGGMRGMQGGMEAAPWDVLDTCLDYM